MCGIAGKISFTGIKVLKKDVERMAMTMKHRGPDDAGAYVSSDGKVGLGHRRLSIIDLSPLGHQPMNYMNRYWIVFNGEIYNYQEKRQMMAGLGYKFNSKTDTEVIVALYHKFGVKCLKHLRGMFSFAIYDDKEKSFFCARDRVGKKPFKYYVDDNVFMFASELKAILTQKEYKREPDYMAIHHYLTLQYVPCPLTGFKEIKKLEPAHFLYLDLKSKKMIKKRYWKLDYSKKLELSETEWQKRIMDKLTEAVKYRLISDVPLGAFLSGGIDSSAVVGLMSRLSQKPIKTFSIGFAEEKYNELKFAKMIAKKFKTDHAEFVVKPDAIEVLPMLVKQYEEPYADSSAIPTYYVSKLTRDHVTVALNGDGGDENFAGYGRYSVQKFSLWYDYLGWLNRGLAVPVSKMLAKNIGNIFFDRVERFARSMAQDYRFRYLNYVCYFDNESKANLYTDEFKGRVWGKNTYDLIAKKFDQAGTADKMDQTLYVDFTSYLPDDLMVKVDMATMLVALEGRSPFLDQEFLELTAKIPFNLKLKGGNDKKYILKKALEGFIPNEILYRPKKGFGVPLEFWFRGSLRKYAESILLSDRMEKRGMFKKEYVKGLLKRHMTSQVNLSAQIWALLTLELWFREYFD